METIDLKKLKEDLDKEVKRLQHIKDVLNNRIKSLAEEELRYLRDIPIFRQQSKDFQAVSDTAAKRTVDTKAELSIVSEQLKEASASLLKAHSDMKGLKENSDAVFTDVANKRKEIDNQLLKCKHREIEIGKREETCLVRESQCAERENGITKTEVALENEKKKTDIASINLNGDREAHVLKVKKHDEREAVFNENRKAHFNEQDALKLKHQEVDSLLAKNSDIQVSLLLKKKDLDEEIAKTKLKQQSLDKNIADLDSERKKLEIMDLKIRKLAREAGIDKELKELKESLK